MPLHSYTKRMLSQLLLIGSICEKCSENQNVTKKTSNSQSNCFLRFSANSETSWLSPSPSAMFTESN